MGEETTAKPRTWRGKPAPIWLAPLAVFIAVVGIGFVIPLHYTLLDRIKLGAVQAFVWLALALLSRRYGGRRARNADADDGG